MYSHPTGDENLFNFPLTKSAFDPNEIPFVGSLPESLRVFREALGYDLRFVRAGSSELASPRGDVAGTRATFPIEIDESKVCGFLVLERSADALPQVDWDAARRLASTLASNLSENYRWRFETEACEGELAAAAIKHIRPCSCARSSFSIRLRDVLRVGASALGEFDAAALYLLDDATTCLSPRALWGLPDERFLDAPRPLRTARAEVEALLGNAVVVNEDCLAEAWNVPEDFVCSICVPVMSDTTILGVVWFFSNKRKSVGLRELETLNMVSGRIVDVLEKEALVQRGMKIVREGEKEPIDEKYLADCSDEKLNELIDSILSNVKL